jgi:nicotinic acid mononucleotide adenylyltransferase
VRIVSGYFDPLLATHAARFEVAADGVAAVAVVLLDPPDPILSSRARAELVAALARVSLVLVPGESEAPEADVHFEREDLEARALFMAHVRERQS